MAKDQNNLLPLLLLGGVALLSLGSKAASKFILPVRGKIASGFGDRINPVTKVNEFHNGIDIAVPEGTPVRAPENGIVTNVYKTDVGGNQIVISHPDGFITGYAHLSAPMVKIKDQVSKGQTIGLSGHTGQVTGPHLHLSLRGPDGKYIDPEEYFSFT